MRIYRSKTDYKRILLKLPLYVTSEFNEQSKKPCGHNRTANLKSWHLCMLPGDRRYSAEKLWTLPVALVLKFTI